MSKLFTESECQHIASRASGRLVSPPAQKPAPELGGSASGLVENLSVASFGSTPQDQTVTRNASRSAGAARVAAYRERHGVVSFTVDLPRDVVEGIESYMQFKNLTRSAVIAKLVRSQLLRKR